MLLLIYPFVILPNSNRNVDVGVQSDSQTIERFIGDDEGLLRTRRQRQDEEGGGDAFGVYEKRKVWATTASWFQYTIFLQYQVKIVSPDRTGFTYSSYSICSCEANICKKKVDCVRVKRHASLQIYV